MGILDSVFLATLNQNISLGNASQELVSFGSTNSLVNFYQPDIKHIEDFENETARIYGLNNEVPTGALILQKNLLIATAMAGKSGISIFFEDGTKARTLQNSGLSYCHPLNMLATIGHMARMVDMYSLTQKFARLASKLDIIDMKYEPHYLFGYTHSLYTPTQEIIKLDTDWYLDSQAFQKLQEYYKLTFHFDLLELIEQAIQAAPTS